MIEIEFIINAKTVNQPGFFVYFLPFMEYSSLGHEKLISVSQAPPHSFLDPRFNFFYPRTVPIFLSNIYCLRYPGFIFNSSAYLLQV